MEVWKPIGGVSGYEVSNLGRVRSWRREKPHIMKPLPFHGWNYLSVMLIVGENSKRGYFSLHRLVAQAFIPNPENKPEVNHINGDKTDNRAENLEWCTRAENMRRAVNTGAVKTGEAHAEAKLTNKQVLYIRENTEKLTCNQLGKIFNVNPATVSLIQLGKTYRKVGGTLRKPQKHAPPATAELREEIKRLYVKGSKDFNCYTLAKKFGYSPAAICKIVNSK